MLAYLDLIYLLLLALLANLVWVSRKGFMFYRFKSGFKHHGFNLMELIVWYGLALVIAHLLEIQEMGQASPQGWEFYTITFALFLVLSFPGFVYRVLWR